MMSILNYPHLSIFILAWFVADLLFPLLIRLGHRLQMLDRPGGHKAQETCVPYFGGIGIFVAFAVAVTSTLRFSDMDAFLPLLGLVLGGAAMLVLGLMDDLRPIHAMTKLGTILATTLLLACFDITLRLFPDVMGNLPNILITVLWIAGVTSAMNSLDNTDGVTGGISAIAAFFIFLVAWGSSSADAQPWLSYLSMGLVGSCLGFLRYNWAPARIYLGDNGSFLLGYALATLLVFGHYSTDPIKAILVPCLILVVPLFDITLATLLRWRDGDVRSLRDAVVFCGRDHLAHLLQALGFTRRQTALALYALAITGGMTGLTVLAIDARPAYLAVTGLFLAFLTMVSLLVGRVRHRVTRETTYLPRTTAVTPNTQRVEI